jgi:hypothetical protein
MKTSNGHRSLSAMRRRWEKVDAHSHPPRKCNRNGAPVPSIRIERILVPIDFTRRLYAAITAPKTLKELPGADHNDYELLAGDEVIQSILTFVRRL